MVHTFEVSEVPSLQRRFGDVEQGRGSLGASTLSCYTEAESGIWSTSPCRFASIHWSMDFETDVEVLPS